ncbi:MAG: hypothetical protein FWC47_14040 [Oscillospiraceae bacterium]|nr:hypothetical protein [Oscillospiraceae bacterium]
MVAESVKNIIEEQLKGRDEKLSTISDSVKSIETNLDLLTEDFNTVEHITAKIILISLG